MSPLVKSGWGGGKRGRKRGGNAFNSIGCWMLVMAIDYSNHSKRAVTVTQHWLNGYISSTSSQISPDG